MKNIKVILFLFFVLGINCSDAPTKIERTNPFDPEMPGFEIAPVQSVSTNILENREISVSWIDSSIVPTHYVLRKKLNGSEEFISLDTLDRKTKEYVDETGKIFKDTEYEIISIRKQESGEIVFSQGVNSGIEFGDFVSKSYSYNADTTAIVFNWEFDSAWPFTIIATTFDNDLQREIVLDTLSNTNTYTAPTFEKDFQDKYFDLKFFVSDKNIDLENPYERYSGIYHVMEFIPEITNIEVINEGKVKINWEDNSSFEDGFRVLRYQGLNRNHALSDSIEIATVPPNTTSFTDTLNPFIGYIEDPFGGESESKTYYGIQAYKNDTKTGTYGYQVNFTPPSVTLSVSDLTTESFKLHWSTSSPEKVSQFTLQASSNGNSFFDYKTFSKETFESIETDLSKNSVHYFRIKTKTSKYSNTLALNYASSLVEKTSFPFTNSRNIRFSDNGNLIIVSQGFFVNDNDAERVAIFDIKNNSTLYNKAPIGSAIVGIDIDEQKNLMALASPGDQSFTLYDYDADSIVYKASSVNVFDIEFGPNNDFAYTNSASDEVYKFDLFNKSVKYRKPPFSATSTLRSISISPTGDSIAYNSDGYFRLLNSSNFRPIDFSHVSDFGSTAQKVDYSKSGKYISNVSDFNKAEIHFTNPSARYLLTSAEHISISFNDKYYITSKNSLLNIYELDSNRPVLNQYSFGEVLDLRFSPTEELIAIGTKNGVYIYGISNEKKWSLRYN